MVNAPLYYHHNNGQCSSFFIIITMVNAPPYYHHQQLSPISYSSTSSSLIFPYINIIINSHLCCLLSGTSSQGAITESGILRSLGLDGQSGLARGPPHFHLEPPLLLDSAPADASAVTQWAGAEGFANDPATLRALPPSAHGKLKQGITSTLPRCIFDICV